MIRTYYSANAHRISHSTVIKTYLVGQEKITPKKEIVFLPVRGTSSIPPTVSIIQGKNFELPFVIVDSDHAGKERARSLKKDFYKQEQNKIIEIQDITNLENTEVEDLLPKKVLADIFQKLIYQTGFEGDDFQLKEDEPITEQMTLFIKNNNLKDNKKLEGWKTEISKRFKEKFNSDEIDPIFFDMWKSLFDKFSQ